MYCIQVKDHGVDGRLIVVGTQCPSGESYFVGDYRALDCGSRHFFGTWKCAHVVGSGIYRSQSSIREMNEENRRDGWPRHTRGVSHTRRGSHKERELQGGEDSA